MALSTCIYVHCYVGTQRGQKRALDSLEPRVTGDCEMPTVGVQSSERATSVPNRRATSSAARFFKRAFYLLDARMGGHSVSACVRAHVHKRVHVEN